MELKLHSLQYVVFDEADRLFEMGFSEQQLEIITTLPVHKVPVQCVYSCSVLQDSVVCVWVIKAPVCVQTHNGRKFYGNNSAISNNDNVANLHVMILM